MVRKEPEGIGWRGSYVGFRMVLTLLQARPTAEGNPKPLPMAKALSLEPKYITQNLRLILSLAEQATVRLLRSRPPARLTGPPASSHASFRRRPSQATLERRPES